MGLIGLSALSALAVLIGLAALIGVAGLAAPARAEPAKLPGRCVAIPNVVHRVAISSSGVDSRGRDIEGEQVIELRTTRFVDVDGDGTADAFVPEAAAGRCPDEVAWRVFAVRGSCGHDLGVVGPGTYVPDAAPIAPGRIRTLHFTSQRAIRGARGIPAVSTVNRTHAFVNGAYVARAPTSRSAVCHHCAIVTCRAP